MLEMVSRLPLGHPFLTAPGNFLLADSRGNCDGRYGDVIRSLGAVFQLGVKGDGGGGKEAETGRKSGGRH